MPGDRLGEARVVDFDIADARAHRQQIISSEGQGASSAMSAGTSAGCSPSQTGHGLSTAGMRLWSSAHNSFRRRRDDREAAYPLARWRAPGFPQPGHAHRRLPVRRLSVSEAEASLAALVAQRPTLDANVSRCRPDREDARAEYSRRRKVEHPSERFVPAIVRSPMKNEKLQICVFCLCHFLYICGGAGTFAAD